MTAEEIDKLHKENISNLPDLKPNLLNSGIFDKEKNIAFAFMKEFFIKYSGDQMTNAKISDLLSTDVNNMFQHVVHRNEVNTE